MDWTGSHGSLRQGSLARDYLCVDAAFSRTTQSTYGKTAVLSSLGKKKPSFFLLSSVFIPPATGREFSCLSLAPWQGY